MREVNPLPVAPNFGHTYDKKLLCPVYYTPPGPWHAAVGDLQPMCLPTTRTILSHFGENPAHAGQMKTVLALLVLHLLLLGIVLPAASAAVPDELPAAHSMLAAADGWRWPLDGKPSLIGPFDKPAENWLPGHRGVDLAAAPGQTVRAPQRGRVAFASMVADRPVLVIDHGGGFRTSLEPVAATAEVGEWVETGAAVGTVATGAHCSQRCVHWGVRLDGEYIDPTLLIRDMRPSILLPWND